MKRICYLFICTLLLLVSNIKAQENLDCTLNLDVNDRMTEIPLEQRFVEADIPLKFHLVRNGAAAFNDTTHVADLLDIVNDLFIEANIQFEKCGNINYIDDSSWADGFDPYTLRNQLHDVHGIPNVINIYIANTLTLFAGVSFGGPLNVTEYSMTDNVIVINGTAYVDYNTTLLPHELGHYFGLYHPSGHLAYNMEYGFELVDGSNCEVAGDFCCDTPAALQAMCCRFNCEFEASPEVIYDANNDPITPDLKNIMSDVPYSSDCREYFTSDQYSRMSYYHENFLSNMFCSSNLSIEENMNPEVKIFHDSNNRQMHINLDRIYQWNLKIFDITGALLHEENNIYDNSYYLDSREIKSGIYIVELDFMNKNVQAFRSKLIIE